uniref:Uncharacterized protein n=1 Tax=Elaeophora elaphi TaxID=1147741 RepID=A0A0R3RNQ0_9BILA
MVQSTAVRGKFICGQEPAAGIRVKLFENDFSPLNGYSQPVQAGEYMLGNYLTFAAYFKFLLMLLFFSLNYKKKKGKKKSV